RDGIGSVDAIKEDRTQDTAASSGLIRGTKPRGEGLDLICTKVAVDFQSITLTNAEERLKAGLQALTDAYGADALFIALFDDEASTIETVYAGRSTFSTCNPEVLKHRELSEFPWIRGRLEHLRL